MRERCDKHGVTDCLMCQHAAASARPVVVPAPPSTINGGPPTNIEQLDRTDLQAIMEACPFPVIEHLKAENNPEGFNEVSFATLPIDDSHASKVMRAAAEYASAAKQWAERTTFVEKIKSELLKAEMQLDDATEAKDKAEAGLKKLVNG